MLIGHKRDDDFVLELLDSPAGTDHDEDRTPDTDDSAT